MGICQSSILSENFSSSSSGFMCSDRVHTAQSVRLLLLPLDIISGQNLLGTNTAGDPQRRTLLRKIDVILHLCYGVT